MRPQSPLLFLVAFLWLIPAVPGAAGEADAFDMFEIEADGVRMWVSPEYYAEQYAGRDDVRIIDRESERDRHAVALLAGDAILRGDRFFRIKGSGIANQTYVERAIASGELARDDVRPLVRVNPLFFALEDELERVVDTVLADRPHLDEDAAREVVLAASREREAAAIEKAWEKAGAAPRALTLRQPEANRGEDDKKAVLLIDAAGLAGDGRLYLVDRRRIVALPLLAHGLLNGTIAPDTVDELVRLSDSRLARESDLQREIDTILRDEPHLAPDAARRRAVANLLASGTPAGVDTPPPTAITSGSPVRSGPEAAGDPEKAAGDFGFTWETGPKISIEDLKKSREK